MSSSKIQEILKRGDREEIRAFFSFDSSNTDQEVLFKFGLWSRFFFPQYFHFPDAPFHREMDEANLAIYRGKIKSFVNIAFRGASKTTRKKLFTAFVIANDLDHFRKYKKILCKDISNAKQVVTDIYNMFVTKAVKHYYPEIFVKSELKREETMSSFTTSLGVKVKAGTVGMDQRGQLQEDSRPDWIWFDDFETRNTLRSAVETQTIWNNMEEARTGLAKNGSADYTCNYLSERGNVHRLVEKENVDNKVMIVPIRFQGKPMWSAYTVEEIQKIEANADDFAGEYLCEPSAGADIVFDRQTLEKQVTREPFKTVADFKMFYPYNSSHRYGLGADTAGGVGLDSSASVIIDFSTIPNRVVATYTSNTIKPDVFGDEIRNQALRYGEPVVAPENNKYDMVIGRLRQIYENMYFTEQKETRVGLPPKIRTYGWNTNAMTKPKMLFELKKAVEDGHLELTDKDLIAELRAYTRDDLMDRDEDVRLTTRHFDLLMACAIAFQMKDWAEAKTSVSTYQQPAYESPLIHG